MKPTEQRIREIFWKLEDWERKGHRLEAQARQLLRRADDLERAYLEELEVVKAQAYRKAWEVVMDHVDVPDHKQEAIKARLGIA